ncbi:hypothetical protein ACFWPU_43700 [Streptomyces sp. NPDC058471]
MHALAELADLLRHTYSDVLWAYLRLPCTAAAGLPPEDAAARHF